jgi:hypothetical protein
VASAPTMFGESSFVWLRAAAIAPTARMDRREIACSRHGRGWFRASDLSRVKRELRCRGMPQKWLGCSEIKPVHGPADCGVDAQCHGCLAQRMAQRESTEPGRGSRRPATRITSWRKASLRTHLASGLVFESERPIAEIARDLGVHPEALRKRVRQLEADTGRRSDLLESNTRPVEARGFGARPATQPC